MLDMVTRQWLDVSWRPRARVTLRGRRVRVQGVSRLHQQRRHPGPVTQPALFEIPTPTPLALIRASPYRRRAKAGLYGGPFRRTTGPWRLTVATTSDANSRGSSSRHPSQRIKATGSPWGRSNQPIGIEKGRLQRMMSKYCYAAPGEVRRGSRDFAVRGSSYAPAPSWLLH
jgi:hypothetical protein